MINTIWPEKVRSTMSHADFPKTEWKADTSSTEMTFRPVHNSPSSFSWILLYWKSNITCSYSTYYPINFFLLVLSVLKFSTDSRCILGHLLKVQLFYDLASRGSKYPIYFSFFLIWHFITYNMVILDYNNVIVYYASHPSKVLKMLSAWNSHIIPDIGRTVLFNPIKCYDTVKFQ